MGVGRGHVADSVALCASSCPRTLSLSPYRPLRVVRSSSWGKNLRAHRFPLGCMDTAWHGTHAEVVRPGKLRERLLGTASEMCRTYSTADPH